MRRCSAKWDKSHLLLKNQNEGREECSAKKGEKESFSVISLSWPVNKKQRNKEVLAACSYICVVFFSPIVLFAKFTEWMQSLSTVVELHSGHGS